MSKTLKMASISYVLTIKIHRAAINDSKSLLIDLNAQRVLASTYATPNLRSKPDAQKYHAHAPPRSRSELTQASINNP
jgi:hypothetical protein